MPAFRPVTFRIVARAALALLFALCTAARADATVPEISPSTPRESAQLVRPYVTVASATRNLSFGGRATWGRRTGPNLSVALGGDWLLTGLISGLLLDDLGSPRFTGSQVVSWVFAWPQAKNGPPPLAAALRPRLSLGLGAWETAEVDSLLQAARTTNEGMYASYALGGQIALLFPYASVAFAVRPFGGATYLIGDTAHPVAFQFGNAVLDVDLTIDLAALWTAGRSL